MRRKWSFRATLAIVLSATAMPTVAADQASDVVAFRQSVMQLLDGHVNAIMAIVRGKVDMTEHVAAHATSIEELAVNLPDLFPAATGPDAIPTNALLDIWSDEGRFAEAVFVLQREATELAVAARSGDQVAVATEFNSLRRDGCDSCHTSFRRRPSQ